MTMTTKVHIIAGSTPLPIVIQPYSPDDKKPLLHIKRTILRYPGDHFQEYVHSGQAFAITEMSDEERAAEVAQIVP